MSKEDGSQNQVQWLSQMKSELITANMNGDENGDQAVFDQVAELFGNEYARQWRLSVLEEHAQRRINDTLNSDIDY